MLDCYNRKITYLRISVTDKCNLRCLYCMPQEGVLKKEHKEFLTFEQMGKIVEAAAELGIYKIRLTGGEPLVKKDIEKLAGIIKNIKGITYLGVTTNGILLPRLAGPLKKAGVDSLNISMDTLNRDRYSYLTRGGDVRLVLAGIEAAKKEGFPIKINMVVMDDTDPEEITSMRAFCEEQGLNLQLINHYDLGAEKRDDYVFDRPPKCGNCNRIRLLSHGVLKPCLQSDLEIPVDLENPRESLIAAIQGKPLHGSVCTNREMTEIGG